MNNSSVNRTSHAPWWQRLLGRWMRPWVSLRQQLPLPEHRPIRNDQPVCYVLERYGVSNTLILNRACEESGLPAPWAVLEPNDLLGNGRAMLALSRRHGTFRERPRNRTHSVGIARLIAAAVADPDLDVQIVPVSIFVGRAPNRQSGWFRVLFSENWAMVGRFRRFLSVLLNGRDTLIQFASPVSLREVVAEGLPTERAVRKLSRVLRAHFRRIRTAIIGPDLSHRRTLVDSVLAAPMVQTAINDLARKEKLSVAQATGRARTYALEIAADYSHPAVRSASFLLTWVWNKLYDGVTVHHFDSLKQVAPGHEVIYVPSHRSHIDYLLLSYLLYVNGIVPPHIAAGVNLNLPVVGPILRRGGAFFLRRSFKSNALYSAVFSEYVARLISQGVSIEYFIEGGRSRTGRLLEPKAGMLSMTLRAFLRQPRTPVVFQPVYIGYEQVMEGKSYLAELSGAPKKKESLLGLLGAFRKLRHNYGKVAVNFGEPIFLQEILDRHDPDWRRFETQLEEKPNWINAAVDDLAVGIQRAINQAADINPINLLALCLLSTPKHAMAECDLRASLELMKSLMEGLPYSGRVTITALSPDEIIAHGEQAGVLLRTRHPLGDVLGYGSEQAVLQSYYRNNVVHLFAAASWVACCFQNNRRLSRAAVEKLGRGLYAFVQSELFLPWDADEFAARIQATIELLIARGLFTYDAETGMLQRGPGQTDEVFQLRVIAHSLQQAFERYYIAIAILVKNGSGVLGSGELENLCQLTAQRLSLLYSQAAPEFFDRSLFRGFISKLRQMGIVRLDANSKLAFDEALESWAKDARLILSRELRHSILKITPEIAGSVANDSAS